MKNAKGVKLFETFEDLDEDMPDLGLLEKGFLFLFFCYSIVQVAVIGQVHHHTILLPYLPQRFAPLIDERPLVPDHVPVSD